MRVSTYKRTLLLLLLLLINCQMNNNTTLFLGVLTCESTFIVLVIKDIQKSFELSHYST